MKVILTKITLAGEDGRISQNSKEILDAEGDWTVDVLEEKANTVFDDDIEGFKVFHNGFELPEFFKLCDIVPESDTINLDLVNVEEEEDEDVPLDVVPAANATEDKYYIICNVDGNPDVPDGAEPRPVRFRAGRRRKLQLDAFAKDDGGEEYRFGICKRTPGVDKEGEDGTWYHYQLYRFDKNPQYKNCRVTIEQDKVELKAGDVVMLTLTPIPLTSPSYFQPSEGGSAKEALKRFGELTWDFLKGAAQEGGRQLMICVAGGGGDDN